MDCPLQPDAIFTVGDGPDLGQPPFPISTTVDQQLLPRLAYAPAAEPTHWCASR